MVVLRFNSPLAHVNEAPVLGPGLLSFAGSSFPCTGRAAGALWQARPVPIPDARTPPSLPPWPLPHRAELRDALVAAYSTGRGYHDLEHLAEVLDRLDELGWAAHTEVVLAAWFHDAVYDGQAGAEERSALLAETSLAGEPGVDVAEVARLVRLTTDHVAEPGDEAGRALCDADLGILAAPPERYARYVAGVRADYAHVPDEDFRAGRRAVLVELAGREHLFASAYARTHWDAAARANLAAEIAALDAPAT